MARHALIQSVMLATSGLIALALVGEGCASKKPPVTRALTTAPATLPASRPVGPAVFDARRGGGSFPLSATTMPTTISELQAALALGYAQRLLPPLAETGAAPTTLPSPIGIRSGSADIQSLETLTLDYSNYRVRPDYEPAQMDKDAVQRGTLRASDVLYTADPLKYVKGQLSVTLQAHNADLHLLEDKNGQRAVVVAGAESGFLHFHGVTKELEATTFSAAKKGAGKGGVLVTEIRGTLKSDNPRSIEAYLTVGGVWLLLPLEITVGGRMDVGDDMLATFTNIGCTGRYPGGDIVAPFLDKEMKKLNGKTSTLMSFRDGITKATDFEVHIDEHFDLRIAFGRDPKTASIPAVPPFAEPPPPPGPLPITRP